MKVYEGEKTHIKCWCNNPEEGAIEQAKNLAKLPFVQSHVALMPDTHKGYGMPIGGVIACKGIVIPNAVGVDIGCGMVAVKTDYKHENITTDLVKEIMGLIRHSIPVGFNHRTTAIDWEGFEKAPKIDVIQRELTSARKQLGTLGGGNHFIELQKGTDGFVWVMIHSGSRNFGLQIAKEFNKKAQDLCKLWYSDIPEYKGEDGLAFLPMDTKEGKEYIEAMNFALDFALANRSIMLSEAKSCLKKVLDCSFDEPINIHHNYAKLENHFGSNVWVHRKGATSAYEGEYGLIPGSQGTSSYVVIGKGNVQSFKSCSHGAGRAMSRGKARGELNLKEEQEKLDCKGIVHSIRHKKDLDEASSAYKDIDIVMKEQEDLVDIVVKLEPLGVIKG